MTRTNLDELIAHADELADRFETYEPKPEDFDAPLPPLMAVHLAAFKRARAESELADAITVARDAKVSWRALGEAVGTTGEAARQRYSDLVQELSARLDEFQAKAQERLAQAMRDAKSALEAAQDEQRRSGLEIRLGAAKPPPAKPAGSPKRKVAAKKTPSKVSKRSTGRSALSGGRAVPKTAAARAKKGTRPSGSASRGPK